MVQRQMGDKVLADFLKTKRQSKFTTRRPDITLIAQVRPLFIPYLNVYICAESIESERAISLTY